MKKRIIGLMLVLSVILCACGSKDNSNEPSAEPSVGMANPWVDVAYEDMGKEIGLSMGIPEGAEIVNCSILTTENLGQIIFAYEGLELCARIKSTSEFEDISGMYYEWDLEDDAKINYCDGKIYGYKDDTENVHLCMWYDAAPGVMYSLSAVDKDLDGFDITVPAEQVFVPLQGEN